MTITVVTPPATEPLTATEAKAHLRVDHTSDDTLITALIVAAREYAEQYLQRALITQTLRLSLDGFPESHVIELYPSVQSVTSVKYVDPDGVLQTCLPEYYVVDIYSTPGRLTHAYGLACPATREQFNAVEVIFVAGYGAAADVPQAIKQAMLLAIGHWYENREGVNIGNIVNELPLAVDALLAPYRYMRF